MKMGDNDILNRIVDKTREIYGENILAIVLYGSVARNSADSESDIDIALLVSYEDEDMHDKLIEAMVELDLEYNQVISPSIIEKEKYDKWKSVLPYYQNIEKEGISSSST